MKSTIILVAVMISARPLDAQSGVPLVDSAAAARGAWSRAVAALRTGDLEVGRRESERAARAWPVQPAYVWGRAAASARARDGAGVRDALLAYAALGLGRDVSGDTAFAFVRNESWFVDVATRLRANAAPLVRSRVVATLPDSAFWAEGVDYDARTKRFYVASVKHGTIAEVSDDGTVRELWPRSAAKHGALLGVRVGREANVLWATASHVAMAGATVETPAALLRIEISTGRILRRFDLPSSPRGHTLGDLIVTPAGDVFMTDSNEPFIYRLRAGADSLERITHPLFRSLQGLALGARETLLVADYSHGLLRVDLRTGDVVPVHHPAGVTTVGLDGIVFHEGAIIGVQNGLAPARVIKFELDAGLTRIVRSEVLDRNFTIADEPTIGTIRNGEFVYVANSQWEKYREDGTPNGTPLTKTVLLSVPLRGAKK